MENKTDSVHYPQTLFSILCRKMQSHHWWKQMI